MSIWKLILNNLWFYARQHLGVLLGAAVGSAVLIGALVVGDSVRGSLHHFALLRVGQIDVAMPSGDRLFRTELSDRLASDLGAKTAPVIQLLGTAARGDGTARANQVQVLGVDERFWEMAEQSPSLPESNDDFLAVNSHLAAQLDVKTGDSVLLRFHKPSALSREVPLTPQSDFSAALRMEIKAVVTDEELGRFSLRANQVAPFNAYLSLGRLQEEIEQSGRANLLLAGKGSQGSSNLTVEAAQSALDQVWQLEDAGLHLGSLPDQDAIQLSSDRIFLDRPIIGAAREVFTNARGHLTYLVDEIRSDGAMTPYSMVTAMGAMGGPIVPSSMKDDEIVINQWLANDLKAGPGDGVSLTYYVLGGSDRLRMNTNRFTVHEVVPLSGAAADRELMPDFPGVAEAESTHDWEAGFPIDFGKIRPKDETYWDKYRGTPKAFVTLDAGQKMWSNRFGDLTGIRFPAGTHTVDGLAKALEKRLSPGALGMGFLPLRQQALEASAKSYDFGQLFIGFSFFLIVAALLLMALLFQFGIEQRTSEIGTLLALGFRPKQVRNLLLGEGCGLALLGGILGVIGGTGYARLMLYGLGTVWRDAVGNSNLQFYVNPVTLVIGLVAATIVAVLTIWFSIRQHARRPARELLASGAELDKGPGLSVTGRSGRSLSIATTGLVLSIIVIGIGAFLRGRATAGAFFGAGTLMLIAGIGFCAALFGALVTSSQGKLTLTRLGIRNVARRHRRSLATIGLLACGTFLIISVGSFRLEAGGGTEERRSGTGGFELLGQSTLPVVEDLNTQSGRNFFALSNQAMKGVDVVSLRMLEGDDASCLNLNRAQRPRILGVPVDPMKERGAFRFSKRQYSVDGKKLTGWEMLEADLGPNTIPAIGDQATITWALGKQIGDALKYTDQNGQTVEVKLIGSLDHSILQGSLLISEGQFQEHFPGESGYRQFLIDAPNRTEKVQASLSKALRNVGLELIPTQERLQQYNAVQNTYLSTFQVLGGLGLLLGSVGLGVVVLRNVLDRRQELAVLLAVGFRASSLKWLVLVEHCLLLLLGLLVGVVAAVVGIIPALTQESGLPLGYLGLNLLAVLLNGLLWTWLATWFALRGRLLESLRNF